jgi:DNA replication ATP-dependent helicase Dna2
MSLSVNVRDKVTIDTVERYQGSEREVIIFSPALNSIYDFNSVQSLDFEGKVDRKLNVAISRARERFILLGDAELLSQNTHYRHLLKLIPTHWSIDES